MAKEKEIIKEMSDWLEASIWCTFNGKPFSESDVKEIYSLLEAASDKFGFTFDEDEQIKDKIKWHIQ